jgi:protein TonB
VKKALFALLLAAGCASPPPETDSVEAPLLLVRGMRPQMPRAAIAQGIGGAVQVEMVFDESGRVESVRVLRSSHEILSDAVLLAVKDWRIEPPIRDGKAQKTVARQNYVFVAGP